MSSAVKITLTPAQLRAVALVLGDGEEATRLRAIADRIEAGETVVIEQPPYHVTYEKS